MKKAFEVVSKTCLTTARVGRPPVATGHDWVTMGDTALCFAGKSAFPTLAYRPTSLPHGPVSLPQLILVPSFQVQVLAG